MYFDEKILVGKSGEEDIYIYPKMANRHGLIAGATGTGKTVTLKTLAESFSNCGVPVFLADAKGDLAATCNAGIENENIVKRVEQMGLDEKGFKYQAFPVTFWDVYQKKGIPLRTTISEMGPLLLAQVLQLNDVQTAVLNVIFKIADDNELLLIDTKDLRSMLTFVSENAKEFSSVYGNMSKQSLGAITRAVISLESQGGDLFFGEPALDIKDWLCTDCNGRGNIQILDCQILMQNPAMYSAFMLWLMSELFELLPEVGDMDKPKMVFFFDEAHMLFDNASKELLAKVEQVVKLIRSKGVGIYFITQNPADIPDGVLGQLGNKIQHALHAYTPSEQKGAKAAAQAFRVNPEFSTYDELLALGIGEALVSVLDPEGIPTIVKKTQIVPPQSQMGALDDASRENKINGSLLFTKYSDFFDRDSAYEFFMRKHQEAEEEAERAAIQAQKEKEEAEAERQRLKEEAAAEKQREREAAAAEKQREREAAAAEKQRLREEAAAQKQREKEEAAAIKAAEKAKADRDKKIKTTLGRAAGSAAGTIGREIGNELGKTMGGSFGKKIGGNVGSSLGRGLLNTFLKF